MDQITHDVRSSQWLEIITQCQNRPEGTTAKQWIATYADRFWELVKC